MPDSALSAAPCPPAAPALRLVPVPASEPPYDDGGPAPLRLVRYPDPAGPAPVLPHLVVSRQAPAAPTEPAPVDETSPGVRAISVALVHRLLEVRGGTRPLSQLQRDTTPALYADLERGLSRRPRGRTSRPAAHDVRSVHVQHRGDVVEVCATVRRGDRMGALALRLQTVGGRWLCTCVQGL